MSFCFWILCLQRSVLAVKYTDLSLRYLSWSRAWNIRIKAPLGKCQSPIVREHLYITAEPSVHYINPETFTQDLCLLQEVGLFHLTRSYPTYGLFHLCSICSSEPSPLFVVNSTSYRWNNPQPSCILRCDNKPILRGCFGIRARMLILVISTRPLRGTLL